MKNEIAIYHNNECDKNLRQSPLFNLIRKDELNEIESILKPEFSSNDELNHLMNQQRICDGYTPLHCAVEHNKPYITFLLMFLDADPNIVSKTGKSAADLCNILPNRNKNIVNIVHSQKSEKKLYEVIHIICSLKKKFELKETEWLSNQEIKFIDNNNYNNLFNSYFDVDDINFSDYSSIITVYNIINTYIQYKQFANKKHSLLFNEFNQQCIETFNKNTEIYDQKENNQSNLDYIEGINLLGFQGLGESSSDEEGEYI